MGIIKSEFEERRRRRARKREGGRGL